MSTGSGALILDEAAFRLLNSKRQRRWPGSETVALARLARPFPPDARHRIMLGFYADPLAETQFLPFFRQARRLRRNGIAFRARPIEQLDPLTSLADATALFVQAPYDHHGTIVRDLIPRIRALYPEMPISFFDWAAPADLRFAEKVVPGVDHYVKKSILRDRASYLAAPAGHTNLSDHYAARFGTDNPTRDWTVPPETIDRLSLSPSFSTGAALISRFGRAAPPSGERSIDVHARIAVKGTPWYQAMRGEAKAAVIDQLDGLNVATDGFVSARRYKREIARSKICFSPFGYGEICWRDFEAAALGAVLLKPDMSHLETDPDIYVPHETYVPLDWGLSDLGRKARALLADRTERERLARNAYAVVRDHLHGPAVERQIERLLRRKPAAASA